MVAEITSDAGSQGGTHKMTLHPCRPVPQIATGGKGKKDDDDDDDHDENDYADGDSDADKTRWAPWSAPPRRRIEAESTIPPTAFSALPHRLAPLFLRSCVVVTVALYALNQRHMLPMPIGRVVSRALFWPTIPITISRRLGKWTTVVDDAVVIGGAPFGWCGYPERLSRRFNVRGVVNMCDEYAGPASSYARLGMEHLRLPTVDHFEPSVEDLKRAVAFIRRHERDGHRVYVHCRAGHGRSAAAVYAWLLHKEPLADPVELNEKLCSMRDVRKTLWKQPNINIFREWLRNGGMISDSDDDDDDDDDDDYTPHRHEESVNELQTERDVKGGDGDD